MLCAIPASQSETSEYVQLHQFQCMFQLTLCKEDRVDDAIDQSQPTLALRAHGGLHVVEILRAAQQVKMTVVIGSTRLSVRDQRMQLQSFAGAVAN